MYARMANLPKTESISYRTDFRAYFFMRPTRLSRSPPHVCAATSGACIASYTPWIVRRAAGGHVTSNALHSAVMVSPPPLRASLALAQRAFALLSPGRGALRQPRRSPAANSPMVHSDAPRMPATRLLPLWRARRATPRGFLRSPLANGARPRRARGSRDERTVNFSNFFSQLLHRHALQVSIDKERATPPPPPQKKTYHRYTGGSGPGEHLASAL